MARNRTRPYRDTLCLGRQTLNFDPNDPRVISALASAHIGTEPREFIVQNGGYSEGLFSAFGSTSVSSLDFSPFEGADIIWDMNKPIPEEHRSRFDCIFDGGTLEHIYNFPVAIQNVKDMLKVGGLFISINGANNMLGHGLYQFSPELMWRVFSTGTGFKIHAMQLVPTGLYPAVDALDPKAEGRRLEFSMTESPTYLMLVAEKQEDVSSVDIFQSDYEEAWIKS